MDDRKAGGFGLISNKVIRDPALSPEAKSIYSVLCSYADKAGTCFPSISRLCNDLHMNEKRLRRHMQPLLDRGIVTKEQKRGGNQFRGNIYQIIDDVRPPNLGGPKKQTISQGSQNDSLPAQNSPAQNEGTNNNNVRVSDLEDLVNYVCMVLNQHKARHSHKGRLKTGWEAHWTMKYLLSAGFSADQIRQHAKDQPEYEDKKDPSFDWYSFLYSFPGIKKPKYYL